MILRMMDEDDGVINRSKTKFIMNKKRFEQHNLYN